MEQHDTPTSQVESQGQRTSDLWGRRHGRAKGQWLPPSSSAAAMQTLEFKNNLKNKIHQSTYVLPQQCSTRCIMNSSLQAVNHMQPIKCLNLAPLILTNF